MDGGGPGAESQGEILQVYCLPIHPVFTPFCLPDSLPSSLSLQFLFALGTPIGQGWSKALMLPVALGASFLIGHVKPAWERKMPFFRSSNKVLT